MCSRRGGRENNDKVAVQYYGYVCGVRGNRCTAQLFPIRSIMSVSIDAFNVTDTGRAQNENTNDGLPQLADVTIIRVDRFPSPAAFGWRGWAGAARCQSDLLNSSSLPPCCRRSTTRRASLTTPRN